MEPAAPATYDDRVTIATPEGIDLTLTLAGVGSRFASALVDIVIQGLIIVALTIVVAVTGLGGYGGAVVALVSFVVVFGYDVSFEVLASGRTPGKRINGLRVVRGHGQPVDLVTSVIRNLLRIVDFLPASYLVGIISILVTSRNQRLGDLAAGTLVVRERREGRPDVRAPAPPTVRLGEHALDVSVITPEELAAVRRYLARRHELHDDVRRQLAHTLAERLRPKVGGVTDELRGERFLEALAVAKGDRDTDRHRL
jgi:uncharacterized RDD family membrane protein YckC